MRVAIGCALAAIGGLLIAVALTLVITDVSAMAGVIIGGVGGLLLSVSGPVIAGGLYQ